MGEPLIEPDLPSWPSVATDASSRTVLACGHFSLLSEWDWPLVGRRQYCEVCDTPRTVVDVIDLDR